MPNFRLNRTIAGNYDADPRDTLAIKKALFRLGYYDDLGQGVNDWVDGEMYRGIEKFQKDHGLKVDQVVNPGGPTENALNQALAHPSLRNGGRYDPNQPRDDHGRWTSTGGGSGRGRKSLLHKAAGESSQPWTKYPNSDFRQKIAEAEGSVNGPNSGYGEVNSSSGALGRYQLMQGSLQQIGWQDSAGRWTEKAAKHGVRSKEDFLNSPEAQEEAFGDYMRDVERQASVLGLYRHLGTTYTGVLVH